MKLNSTLMEMKNSQQDVEQEWKTISEVPGVSHQMKMAELSVSYTHLYPEAYGLRHLAFAVDSVDDTVRELNKDVYKRQW